jgi:hypothetical protein
VRTLRAEKVQASDKSVELLAHDDNGEHFTVVFPPSVAVTFANSLGVAAREAGDETPLTVERRLRTTNRFTVDRTKSRNARLEWVSWGFRHRIVIDRERIRSVADRLHDLADRLDETA